MGFRLCLSVIPCNVAVKKLHLKRQVYFFTAEDKGVKSLALNEIRVGVMIKTNAERYSASYQLHVGCYGISRMQVRGLKSFFKG